MRRTLRRRLVPSAAMVALLAAGAIALGQEKSPDRTVGPDAKAWQQSVDRAVDYLRVRGQSEDGSFSAGAGPAVTALVVAAALRTGEVTPAEPFVVRSLAYLKTFVQEDGGIYAPESIHRNYETALALVAFQQANRSGQYDALVKHAQAFLKHLQWDENESIDRANPYYGGAGYGGSSRPDLSNTQMLLDALKESGLPPDDPAMKRALIFVSRCQNLESEHNTLPFAVLVGDGGFYYTPAKGGQSQAGTEANGGLRSYGSMTYAGLKSMIYAGVGPDDPRVKAAYQWIRKHYTLETNPGMGAQGLYYYYHTFAKALDALGVDRIADADGVEHDWRRELAEELFGRQQKDGSWINTGAKRWYEGDPNLVTAYALLALSYCKPPGK